MYLEKGQRWPGRQQPRATRSADDSGDERQRDEDGAADGPECRDDAGETPSAGGRGGGGGGGDEGGGTRKPWGGPPLPKVRCFP